MVSSGLAIRLNHKGMSGFMNNIGSNIANTNANEMTSFVSPSNQGNIMWAGIKILKEADVVAKMENVDLKGEADEIGK